MDDYRDRVLFFEQLAFNAWPAETVENVDGWRVRANHATTRRANSVWPNQNTGGVDLDSKLRSIEAFYAKHGLPARFQICPAAEPQDLAETLGRLGYSSTEPTYVQTMDLGTYQPIKNKSSRINVNGYAYMTDSWIAVRANENQDELAKRLQIIKRIRPRTWFVTATMSGSPIAHGMGVFENGTVGIFNMLTADAWRRQGAAGLILNEIIRWAAEQNGTKAYLQVFGENQGARTLYQKAGFTTLYEYIYVEKDI